MKVFKRSREKQVLFNDLDYGEVFQTTTSDSYFMKCRHHYEEDKNSDKACTVVNLETGIVYPGIPASQVTPLDGAFVVDITKEEV